MNYSVAKYREVADKLRGDILAGRYAAGSSFPSVKMICRRFGVSHLTAVKSLDVLKKIGLVKSRNGVGTFVSRKMMSIGLVLPMMRQVEIFPPICQEFSRLSQERGISVDFVDISDTGGDELQSVVVAMASRMASSGVSGVIYHPVDFGKSAAVTTMEVLHIFKKAGIPVVILDADVAITASDDRCDFVGVDNFEIGRFVGSHVIGRGAKNVAFVAWSDMNNNVRRRLDGVMSAIGQKRGAKLVGSHLWMRDEPLLSKRWRKRLPDAIVCTSDITAAHVLKCLGRIGKRCPEDTMVTGVNDVSLASLVSPTLTTVRQPCVAIARAAFETLLWRIENPNAEKRRIMVATELVARESTVRPVGKRNSAK